MKHAVGLPVMATISFIKPTITYTRYMTIRFGFFLSLLALCFSWQSSNAQPPLGEPPRLLSEGDNAAEAKSVVADFFAYGMSLERIDSNRIGDYAIDWFGGYLKRHVGETFWPIPHRYDVGEVYSIRPGDSVLMVTSRAWPDSLPFFGTVTVDWIWFLRRNNEGKWRISSVRRTQNLVSAMAALRLIDSSRQYPNSLKADIAREESAILLSNEQIRAGFPQLRPHLEDLAKLVGAHDSIRFVARNGDRVSQFNTHYLDWGMASHDIPEGVIEEYLKDATEEEKGRMERLLQAAEKQRTQGLQEVRSWERKAGLPTTLLDDITVLMKKGRIQFLNSELPWQDAMLMTIAGELDDAVGFIYSPHGQIPPVSPEEYFYLEDLGGGWWLFRSSG